MKMQFRDFVFPSNPSSVEVQSSANVKHKPIFSTDGKTENVSVNPVVIRGNGCFYGEEGENHCLYLQHLLKTRASGHLLLPSSAGFTAFLTEFQYSKSSKKSGVSYSFVFTEDCGGKAETRSFRSTVAEKGENAFIIANRCDVSVDDIMRLNDFENPFSITEGDRVVIR